MKFPFWNPLATGDRLNALESALYFGRLDRRRFVQLAIAAGMTMPTARALAQQAGDAAITQAYNSKNLEAAYDFIVVGSGSGGAVGAGRLAAETSAGGPVVGAGGTDQDDEVLKPRNWRT